MPLALIIAGSVLVAIAMANRIPALAPPRHPAMAHRGRGAVAPPPRAAVRLAVVPARLTEAGRAALTTLGGSIVIVAFFLALST